MLDRQDPRAKLFSSTSDIEERFESESAGLVLVYSQFFYLPEIERNIC